jgi:hypothetical protein
VIAVSSVHTECLDRNGESGRDDLFGITTGAKSVWRAKKSECIKGKNGLGELNRRGIGQAESEKAQSMTPDSMQIVSPMFIIL